MSKLHVTVISLLMFVAIATAATRTLDNSCPDGVLRTTYRRNLKLYDGSCFQFVFNKEKTYTEASLECRYHGGTLALPKMKYLNGYLARMIYIYYRKTKPVWIGLHDMRDETRFVWEDNTRMQWNNFAKGNGPGNNWIRRGIEDCVALDPMDDGLWHDYQCYGSVVSFLSRSNTKKPYICQYTLDLVDDKTDTGQGYKNQQVPDQKDVDELDTDVSDKDQQTTVQPAKEQQTTQSPVKGQQTTQSPVKGQQTTQSPVKGLQTTQSPVKEQHTTQSPLEGQETTQSPLKLHSHHQRTKKLHSHN
ncbi:LOW QUALITY PROTEIN: collectin-11 [Elysia marginata]|uniref:Collectin-11 n=1 Tax=Elysia marginata TaxID=1093978 RepID=A0AAV4ERN7_9GAST|nr:LOW QUALITY PROTEIN: collectin-11 [Elysia marginata]